MSAVRPDPEVLPKAKRRAFTAAYKRAFWSGPTAAPRPARSGAGAPRGLVLVPSDQKWRRERDAAVEAALAPHKRGRPATPRDPKALRIVELERSSPHLRHPLRQAQAIIEVQKKSRR